MLFRLYDNENRYWVDDFYIAPSGEAVVPKKSLFGTKLNAVSDLKYTYHMKTGLWDKNGNDIYEGDICEFETEERTLAGIVAYIDRDASYYIFDNLDARYYPLSQFLCDERVEVIGNVFDGVRDDKKLEALHVAFEW